jgi:ADP-ribosylglycohydrolase
MDRLYRRVLGSIVGATIGDAIGIVVEFRTRDFVLRYLDGADWVDDMLDMTEHGVHPAGLWRENPPAGTGTDDTRLNHIFLECVINNHGHISSQLLATEYVERCRHLDRYYPEHQGLARDFLAYHYPRACLHLGITEVEEAYGKPLLPAYRHEMNSFPMLVGLLTCQSAGLLFEGDPAQAYLKAAEIAFFDTGYARDATAMLAAVVSAALAEGQVSGRDISDVGIATNPLEIGGAEGKWRRLVTTDWLFPNAPCLERFFEIVDTAGGEREAIAGLARAAEGLHPFDSLDVFGVPLACVRFTDGDPVRSILMAANHRRVDENGELIGMRDVDCTAMIAGVIVGALHGVDAFPDRWVDAILAANKEVYGIDIESTARRFYEAVHGAS